MKILLPMTCYDYEGCYPSDEGFLVPDDFDEQQIRQQWNEETAIPCVGKNQYGEWKSKKYKQHNKTLLDWLREKFEKVDVVALEN